MAPKKMKSFKFRTGDYVIIAKLNEASDLEYFEEFGLRPGCTLQLVKKTGVPSVWQGIPFCTHAASNKVAPVCLIEGEFTHASPLDKRYSFDEPKRKFRATRRVHSAGK